MTPLTRQTLLGIPILDLSPSALIAQMLRAAAHQEHIIVAHVNIHAMNLAYERPRLYTFFRERADMVFCDGFGVKLGARLSGIHLHHRMTLPDCIDELCERCAEQQRTLFLLGAREGIAQRAAERLADRHPNLKIVGVHHGYFDPADNEFIIQTINQARPDILLVAFGMPLQEYWLMDNWNWIDARVAITAGALFDYLSGELQRPPRWMTDHGLEWFGRLFIEPGRLWQRYIIGNPRFFWRILKSVLSIRPEHILP